MSNINDNLNKHYNTDIKMIGSLSQDRDPLEIAAAYQYLVREHATDVAWYLDLEEPV